MIDNNINMILDITPTEVNIVPTVGKLNQIGHHSTPSDSNKDFEDARLNIQSIIHKGSQALDYALDIARSSEHPRTFEVVGQLIKTLVDANKDMLHLHKQKSDIDANTNTGGQQNINAVFVGNTSDLLRLIKDKKNENN